MRHNLFGNYLAKCTLDTYHACIKPHYVKCRHVDYLNIEWFVTYFNNYVIYSPSSKFDLAKY